MSQGYTAKKLWTLAVKGGQCRIVNHPENDEVPEFVRVSMAAIDPCGAADGAKETPFSTLKMCFVPGLEDEDSDFEDDDEDDEDDDNDSEDDDDSEDKDDCSDDGEECDGKKGGVVSMLYNRMMGKKATSGPQLGGQRGGEKEDGQPGGEKSTPDGAKPDGLQNGVKKLAGAAKKSQAGTDEEMTDAGAKKDLGGAEDETDSESDFDKAEVAVVCTLNRSTIFQQPLDILIPIDATVMFMNQGSHTIHLTGNVVTPDGFDENSDDEDGFPVLKGSENFLGEAEEASSDESDVLDASRITEISTDDEPEPPKLVTSGKKAGKKRTAHESVGLDEIIGAEDIKSSKKAKRSGGGSDAVNTAAAKKGKEKRKDDTKIAAAATGGTKFDKGEKKVQFAKNLEQGPTDSPGGQAGAAKSGSSITVVKGVTIDDRKIGQGRKSKAGDKVGVRYIGKLENGTVFDANKKGPAFSFKLGSGDVIKGWDIGVAGMQVGGERRIIVPANMGYGKQAVSKIPANSKLIFDVKLLEIK